MKAKGRLIELDVTIGDAQFVVSRLLHLEAHEVGTRLDWRRRLEDLRFGDGLAAAAIPPARAAAPRTVRVAIMLLYVGIGPIRLLQVGVGGGPRVGARLLSLGHLHLLCGDLACL